MPSVGGELAAFQKGGDEALMHCSGVLGHVKNWHFNNSLPKVQKIGEEKKNKKTKNPPQT